MGKVTNRKVAPMPKLHFGTKNSILAKTTEVPFIGFTARYRIGIEIHELERTGMEWRGMNWVGMEWHD